ncbi:glycosyltransferase family 9 protein [Rhodocytophaga aerolata]|uniref:Glycosyltransferase family 9 protein n=1 Tax=Rhodocytophaga aerolata TaxID=455078 RepID=A0ABT8QXR5_9BACT|nr:glycosyltransferase family 9 protein [Rhodocytophaga aerolata]MDO1444635.1 glycosyltransferase family 9 protein [Rhodocytophaga aerolata]
MLTAAIRDLHLNYPGKFISDVRTSCSEIWENNPWLTPLEIEDPEVTILPCSYPLIHQSNELPYHFIHGFINFLNHELGLQIQPTAFKGDIHLSALEQSWLPQVAEITGEDNPFWIIVAGGKFDYTAKWWAHDRYQAVVEHFRDKIQFVQVGQLDHYHPLLDHVIDLRGKTDLRQLVRLVYHAAGVITPISLIMHLAAAVPSKPGLPPLKPCVVIAGGRESTQWEAYPNHQFIHTIGALPCCAYGGCWKSRVLPLRDGDEKDQPENLCVDPVGFLPHCMDMISAEEVIRRVELFYQGGILSM